jgi:hypothetical protein
MVAVGEKLVVAAVLLAVTWPHFARGEVGREYACGVRDHADVDDAALKDQVARHVSGAAHPRTAHGPRRARQKREDLRAERCDRDGLVEQLPVVALDEREVVADLIDRGLEPGEERIELRRANGRAPGDAIRLVVAEVDRDGEADRLAHRRPPSVARRG